MTVVGDASFIDDQQNSNCTARRFSSGFCTRRSQRRSHRAGGGPKQELHRVLRDQSGPRVVAGVHHSPGGSLPHDLPSAADVWRSASRRNRSRSPANPPGVIPQPGNAPAPAIEDKAPVEEKKARRQSS